MIRNGKEENMRGLGYRQYNITYFCSLCNKHNMAVFVLGWGNFLRCQNCLLKVADRKGITKGTPFQYFRGQTLVRNGFE